MSSALLSHRVFKKFFLAKILLLGVFVAYIFLVPKFLLGNIFFGDVPVLYNTSVAHFFYNQAIRFDSKMDLPPPYVHYQLSRIYFINGDSLRSLIEAGNELRFYPDHVHTNYIKGLTLGYMGMEREAILAFAKFLEYKPDSWAARNDKAWLHFRLGEIDKAMETIIPAVETNPGNPWVMNTFGVLLMNHRLYDEAKNALTSAQMTASTLTSEQWGIAYPGNSPKIYDQGLDAMRLSIQQNLDQIEVLMNNADKKSIE